MTTLVSKVIKGGNPITKISAATKRCPQRWMRDRELQLNRLTPTLSISPRSNLKAKKILNSTLTAKVFFRLLARDRSITMARALPPKMKDKLISLIWNKEKTPLLKTKLLFMSPLLLSLFNQIENHLSRLLIKKTQISQSRSLTFSKLQMRIRIAT